MGIDDVRSNLLDPTIVDHGVNELLTAGRVGGDFTTAFRPPLVSLRPRECFEHITYASHRHALPPGEARGRPERRGTPLGHRRRPAVAPTPRLLLVRLAVGSPRLIGFPLSLRPR